MARDEIVVKMAGWERPRETNKQLARTRRQLMNAPWQEGTIRQRSDSLRKVTSSVT